MTVSERRTVTAHGIFNTNMKSTGPVYSIEGVRGRHINVYEDKAVISTSVGIGSILTGNVSDGEKTIYYVDCIGV